MTKHSINPEDTDGGITAAAIEKETETPDYWRECAEGLHATVVKLQDAEEVLRARAERAESERDEAEARECKDLDVHWRYVVVLDDLAQAQKERDEADRRTSEAEEQRDQWKKHHDRVDGQWAKAEREVTKLRAAQETRGFTAEDVTEGMVDRGHRSLISHHGYGLVTRSQVRDALTDALIEPKRPEGAEAIEALLAGSWPMDREGLYAAANDLAINGVRVVTEEQQ